MIEYIDQNDVTVIWNCSCVCFADAVAMFSNEYEHQQSSTAHHGFVLSHSSFPSDYSENINVTYTITGLSPRQQELQLTFFKFDVEVGTYYACTRDALYITGIQTTSASLAYCGNDKPPLGERMAYHITDSAVSFRFKSDHSINKEGFFFSYTGTCNVIQNPELLIKNWVFPVICW